MVFELTAELFTKYLVVSGLFLLFAVLFALAAFVEQLRLGLFLLFEVLLFFMIVTKQFGGEWQALGFSLLFLFVLYSVVKAFFAWRQFSDLYKVAGKVVPAYEAEFFRPVNFRNVHPEYFKGYYLMEYVDDGLTVAWHKDKGVVARRHASLEQFKKYFVPEEAAEPRPVSGEKTTEVGGEPVEES